MRYIITSFLFLFYIGVGTSQEMHPEKLKEIITEVSDTLQTNGNAIQFMYQERILICIYDENANRMRIISPIVEREQVEEEQLLNALVANFHSALDVKYALSDEVIWSVFTHPLRELSEHQLRDAIQQVFAAAATFGTTYSSTNLVFPGNSKKKEPEEPEKIIKKT
ncbi:hypothetical protein WIW50_18430 [Flavobacteriaceae bacterium 3-367]|uniref:hypothetical protein n=1 Tax=Eudoraea algarum TaxID=3417568 RepID=UPI0032817839